jgi:hypothetical protein
LTRIRNYQKEHEFKKENKKRLIAELEKEKAIAFLNELKSKNITYSAWLNMKIDEELKA